MKTKSKQDVKKTKKVKNKEEKREFDPGSGQPLTECITHTRVYGSLRTTTWRTGEKRVKELAL